MSAVAHSGRPIRVLLVAPSLDILGGQAVQASRLFEGLRREPSIRIDFLPMNPRLGVLEWLKRIKYVRTAVTVSAFMALLLWRARRYDILHVFSAAYTSFLWSAVPVLLAGRLFGKRTVLNYRDGQAADHLQNWRTAALARLADRIVTPSDYLVNVFARFGYSAQPIFNTIDMSRFHYRERRPLRPVFLHNRILEPLYNVPCTLRAFEIIQRKYPEASLTIAHDGPSRGELEQMARDMRLRNTRFIGRVPHERMPELYDAVDIYLTSPDFDCMPGSLLECYASGLPIIATKAGGIPYIAHHEETALLVDCNDSDAIARAAFRLLDDPNFALRLVRGGRRELAMYGWPPVRDGWLRTYRELAGRAGV